MDPEFLEKMTTVVKQKKRFWLWGKNNVPQVEMEFAARDGYDCVILRGNRGEVEHRLKSLQELYIPESEKPTRRLGGEEAYMPILTAIEQSIVTYYLEHPSLKDREVIQAMEKLSQKPEMTTENVLLLDILLHLRLLLSLNDYTRYEVRWALRKILSSVRRHHKIDGPKGYLDFIVDYV